MVVPTIASQQAITASPPVAVATGLALARVVFRHSRMQVS